MDGFWINDLDLSTLTSEQFSTFFVDRPIVENVESTWEMYLGEFEAFAISAAHPAALVANVQAMCRNFAELAKIYSPEQLDQGLWAIFARVRCGKYLFDSAINSRLRIDCVESMYLPFRDVVARRTTNVKDSFIGCGGTRSSTIWTLCPRNTNLAMRLSPLTNRKSSRPSS